MLLIKSSVVIHLHRNKINEVVDSLKVETASITDPHIKNIFTGLFSQVEVLASENEKLTIENQQLKNKINVLQGEQGKPNIKPKNNNKKDISSEQERKDDDDNQPGNGEPQNPKKKKRNRQPKLPDIKIDRKQLCEIDKSILPSDAVNKGFAYTVIQDIKIITDNVEYCRERYS